MDWIVTAGLILLVAVGLPRAIRAAKASVRGNSRLGGVALSIGLALSVLYDPRKREVVETIAKRENADEDRERQREP